MNREPLVGDLDEAALLEAFLPLLPAGRGTSVGPGDDAAVVAAPDGRVVISTDVLVEDHHFRRTWSSGEDVGWRAAMQNLADVAAMGAEPTAVVVSLVVPPDLPVAWIVAFARGLARASAAHGAGVVGGDLSAGDRIVVAVTVHGDLGGREPVLRSGARPGDAVAVAGTLGRSAGGLALLRSRGAAGLDVAPEDDGALSVYRRPDPPLAAGPKAADAGAHALIDVSDGLLRDAGRVALASGAVVDLESGALEADRAALAPLAARLGAGGSAVDPMTWVLTGGEDHALLAAFPAAAALPPGFRRIGTVRAPSSRCPAGTVLVDGAAPPVAGRGWDHFAPA